MVSVLTPIAVGAGNQNQAGSQKSPNWRSGVCSSPAQDALQAWEEAEGGTAQAVVRLRKSNSKQEVMAVTLWPLFLLVDSILSIIVTFCICSPRQEKLFKQQSSTFPL